MPTPAILNFGKLARCKRVLKFFGREVIIRFILIKMESCAGNTVAPGLAQKAELPQQSLELQRTFTGTDLDTRHGQVGT